jgi:DNA-binding GntR family transcriptional regulator
MRSLPHQPTLVDQVYEAILSAISAGKYGPDNRLIQEELAEALGVSRQPVQQALLILRSQGLLRDAPGRGLMVAPLDAEHVRNVYEIRGMIDGLASAKAAERGRDAARREGPAFIEHGRAAVASGSIPRMIAADMDFHFFLYGLSGNPLIQEVSAVHWSHLRRVMGEVLQHGEPPKAIWDQHEAILDAVIAGDADAAERLARHHIANAGEALTPRVETTDADVDPPFGAARPRARTTRRTVRRDGRSPSVSDIRGLHPICRDATHEDRRDEADGIGPRALGGTPSEMNRPPIPRPHRAPARDAIPSREGHPIPHGTRCPASPATLP